MAQVTPVFLVLCLALVAPGFSARECKLTGEWVNDLGSNMTIGLVDIGGKFDGYYLTTVKNAPGNIHRSPLVGFQHNPNTWSQPTFGFTVNWNFSDLTTNSITVFTGQCFVDERGKEILKTMWLLRSGVDNIKDDWKATMVGTNSFTRLDHQGQSGIMGDCNADRSTFDADYICCRRNCF